MLFIRGAYPALIAILLFSGCFSLPEFDNPAFVSGERISCAAGYSDIRGFCEVDRDEDGVPELDDCDDRDPTLGEARLDQDCDGAVALDDCDDLDPASTLVTQDADCDGVRTELDCDDLNPGVGQRLLPDDLDCDGVPRSLDCDDDDRARGAVSSDRDCDGIITEDDCDDFDAASLARSADLDCDGVPSDDDCDDANPTFGLRSGNSCQVVAFPDGVEDSREYCVDVDLTQFAPCSAENSPAACSNDADCGRDQICGRGSCLPRACTGLDGRRPTVRVGRPTTPSTCPGGTVLSVYAPDYAAGTSNELRFFSSDSDCPCRNCSSGSLCNQASLGRACGPCAEAIVPSPFEASTVAVPIQICVGGCNRSVDGFLVDCSPDEQTCPLNFAVWVTFQSGVLP